MTNTTKIKVDAPTARAAFALWLSRGDAVAVFENADLCHPDQGRLIFTPVTQAEQAAVKVGVTRAPDGRAYGLGWRYILKSIETTIHSFEFVEPPPGGRCLRCAGALPASAYDETTQEWAGECGPCKAMTADDTDDHDTRDAYAPFNDDDFERDDERPGDED